MTKLSEIWHRLSVDRQTNGDFVRLRVGGVTACSTYAARSLTDSLQALIIEISTLALPHRAELSEARGIRLSSEALTAGRSGRTRIILALTDGQFEDVFEVLAQDVVNKLESVKTEETAARAFVSRIAHWQRFLKLYGRSSLPREKRLGLLGELLFLHDNLSNCVPPHIALHAWKGCEGAIHDFELPTGAVEVKTTTSNTPHSFLISNVKQLDEPSGRPLFIFFVHASETAGGTVTLNSLIAAIRKMLPETELDRFEDLLTSCGYLQAQSAEYEQDRYQVISRRYFRVREGFPRLRLIDLPLGVEEVRYEVALAACREFEVPEVTVLDELRMESGESQL
jgi:hypothetical protein